MPFTIPDKDESFAPMPQSRWMQTDIDALVQGLNGEGVLSGCEVTAQGSPDMTVAVAAGTVVIGDATVTVASGNVNISAADGTHPRYDLISVNNSGTKTHTAGTASATPKAPALPANSVLLAAIYVPANDTTIASNQIVDKRVVVRRPVDIQTFTADGTWTKPANAKMVHVIAIGGGGGGGSGRKGAAGTIRCGGGGGSGGGFAEAWFPASFLGSTESVTVGQGGNNGTIQGTNSTNGNSGSNGTQSEFGGHLAAAGGALGAGGTATTGTGGVAVFGWPNFHGVTDSLGSGGDASTTGGVGNDGGPSPFMPGGGAAGGGITSGNSASAGGAGGFVGTPAINVAHSGYNTQVSDVAITANLPVGGPGGDGGAGHASSAGPGSNGYTYGGGGGGGGAATNDLGNSGAGGDGADGIVVVISHF